LGIGQKEEIMEAMTSWEERGWKKGIKKERQTIALNMIKGNIPLEQISQFTGLSIAQLQKLQAEV
jgi:predicted transposase/invertase (TIGR01784 family)